MLIELHTLTSHAPANLNRDDLGRPKSAVFGGTQRARVSSQAIKRSIRTSNYLAEHLENGLSTRSRQLPEQIHDQLIDATKKDEAALAERIKKLCIAFTSVIGKPHKKNELHTSQIVFLTPDEIRRSKEHILSVARSDTKLNTADLKDFTEHAAEKIGLSDTPADAVDMALFGRMTTDDAQAFARVDASMQVAHAISTHTVMPEVDWFTAVDDIATGEDETGSGHLGEVEFNSAVFYKYFSCNLPLLITNLSGESGPAIDALASVLDAACRVTPSGKQNSFASHALADTALLVLRQERIPVSLANAFERPVPKGDNGYLAESRTRLVRHYANLREGYQLNDIAILYTTSPEERDTLVRALPASMQVQIVSTLAELLQAMKQHAAGLVKATASTNGKAKSGVATP